MTREKGVWIGKVSLQDEALRSELELVEHVLLYFSDDTPLNERKKNSKPSHSCTVISRFWDKDGRAHDYTGSHLDAVPDVLVWDRETDILHYATRLEKMKP